MASSIQQINNNLSLLGFSNLSVTAIDEQIAIAVGQVLDNVIAEINNSEQIITNLLISQQGYGKALYYTGIALQFQYGDNLVINEAINPVTGAPYLNLIYPVIDTTKQIISQAAFQEAGFFLKVATTGISGGLAPLTASELAAFEAYMLNFEILDLPLNIISVPANILNFQGTATYLASYDLPTLQANLATALANFQTTFPYNGFFYVTDIEQYIQNNVPGMRSFFITNTTLDGTPFSDFISLSSGYFNYNPTALNSIVFNPVTS